MVEETKDFLKRQVSIAKDTLRNAQRNLRNALLHHVDGIPQRYFNNCSLSVKETNRGTECYELWYIDNKGDIVSKNISVKLAKELLQAGISYGN